MVGFRLCNEATSADTADDDTEAPAPVPANQAKADRTTKRSAAATTA